MSKIERIITEADGTKAGGMNEATVRDVEDAIGDLVKRINTDKAMTPERVTITIAEHAKAIVGHATAESRNRLHRLFESLAEMDGFINENEQRLKAEIDKHVEFANSAGRAAVTIEESVAGWRDSLAYQAPAR